MDGFTPEVTETVENSTTNPDGILYITANSASGSKFYGIQNAAFEYAAVQSQERVPNISNVEVTKDSFKITTYRTSDMSVVDTFEIIHKETQTENKPSGSTTSSTTNQTANSSESSSDSSSSVVITNENTVEIAETQTPLSGTFADGMQYDAVNLGKDGKLKVELLQKYYGKNMYLLTYAENCIGYTIETTTIENNAQDVILQSKLEKLPQFAEGFDTIKVSAAKEAKLPFSMAVNVNVGEENIGKTAYIFKKNLTTGTYELGKVMTVNEIGNVALVTNEFTDMMILVMK